MTGNFQRRMDKLDDRIEERNMVAANDREPLTPIQIARILNWCHRQGLLPNATPREKEVSRLISKMFANGFKLTESERAWVRSQ